MPNPTDKSDDTEQQPEEMIDDLESLKELLVEDELAADSASAPLDDDVPLLDDTVEQVLSEDLGMPDETFNALLGDAWQDSVDDLFNKARQTIELNSTAWHPADTDDLTGALKIRIDSTVREWLGETLKANIGLLRERIVSELSIELVRQLDNKLQNTKNQDPSSVSNPHSDSASGSTTQKDS